MSDNILFLIVFLSQIFLLSLYFPRKILGRMRYVRKTYPPSQYPKLYTKPIEYYEKEQRNYQIINQIIFVAGLMLIFAVWVWDFSSYGKLASLLPIVFGMIQMLPVIRLEISETSQFKLMRKANLRTTRKAELRPRRLFDFISPTMFCLAIFMYIAAIFLDLYWHQFNFHWGHDTFERAMFLTAGYFLFSTIIVLNLHGKKKNPHEAYEDRTRQIEFILKSQIYAGIAMSVIFMTVAAGDVFDMDSLEPSLMSLYFQSIAWISIGSKLRTLRIENIDFDVYKEDVSVT